MNKDFISFTPFQVYEKYAERRRDVFAHILRRPLLEYVERYAWLQTELIEEKLHFPILEIGPGSGWGMRTIQDIFPNETVVGMDLDAEALHEGKSYGVANLTRGDLTKGLPFHDSSFQTIVCFIVLEQLNLDTVGPLLNDLHRIAKPDSQFLIASFNRELFSPNGAQWFTPNKHEFTKQELIQSLSYSGWEATESFGQRFVHPDKYKRNAKVFQTIQQTLSKLPLLRQSRFFQIMTPRLQNIAPSINPYTTVEPTDRHEPREPVINIIMSRKQL